MKWIGYVVGALFVLTGFVWILQGIGVLPGSFMTGEAQWAFAGVGALLIGTGTILWVRNKYV